MERPIMTNINQLELGLSTAQRLANSLNHRQRRTSRARWWFTQMRRAVDTALVWQPVPAARPEQTWFDHPRLSGRIQLPPATASRQSE
jgi:hypothetical protein